MATGMTARLGALSLLDRVLIDGDIPDEFALSGSGAEQAEARGLAEMTLRWLGEVDALLSDYVDRTPPGSAHQILRLMATELVIAGTAAHAAVDLGVRLARHRRATGRFAGLINAVGRRIAHDAPGRMVPAQAAHLTTPKWLRKRLERDWGEDVASAIAEAHLMPAPHDLTVKVEADRAALAEELEAIILPTGSLRLQSRPQISALPGYDQGAWWVQDAAAAIPATLVPEVSGKRVLDLCSAPGGKAMQLAAAGAHVTALDSSGRRLKTLRQNAERTALDIRVVEDDLLTWMADAPYDAVLLDAPCSATGTIRRHPDLPQRRSKPDLPALTALQARMLDRAAMAVTPGGCLVYCTCSIFQAEGEDQIKDFLARNTGFKVSPVETAAEVPEEFVTRDGFLRTLPHQWAAKGGLDGFFAARMTKV